MHAAHPLHLCQRCGKFDTDLWQNQCYSKIHSWGAVTMAFAIGIFIVAIAATTIIGATWLALTESGDLLR